MIDELAVVRNWVAGRAKVQAVAGERVYGDVRLPPKYRPEDGPAVLLNVRGGTRDYSAMLIRPSVQVQCWGSSPAEAMRLYRALEEGCHEQGGMAGKLGTTVKWARCDALGQLLYDAETNWPVVISFWTFFLSNDSGG